MAPVAGTMDDSFWGHFEPRNTYKSLADWENTIRGWKGKFGNAGDPQMHEYVWYPKIGLVDEIDERIKKMRNGKKGNGKRGRSSIRVDCRSTTDAAVALNRRRQ